MSIPVRTKQTAVRIAPSACEPPGHRLIRSDEELMIASSVCRVLAFGA